MTCVDNSRQGEDLSQLDRRSPRVVQRGSRPLNLWWFEGEWLSLPEIVRRFPALTCAVVERHIRAGRHERMEMLQHVPDAGAAGRASLKAQRERGTAFVINPRTYRPRYK